MRQSVLTAAPVSVKDDHVPRRRPLLVIGREKRREHLL